MISLRPCRLAIIRWTVSCDCVVRASLVTSSTSMPIGYTPSFTLRPRASTRPLPGSLNPSGTSRHDRNERRSSSV